MGDCRPRGGLRRPLPRRARYGGRGGGRLRGGRGAGGPGRARPARPHGTVPIRTSSSGVGRIDLASTRGPREWALRQAHRLSSRSADIASPRPRPPPDVARALGVSHGRRCCRPRQQPWGHRRTHQTRHARCFATHLRRLQQSDLQEKVCRPGGLVFMDESADEIATLRPRARICGNERQARPHSQPVGSKRSSTQAS